jgi:hypothetical protein
MTFVPCPKPPKRPKKQTPYQRAIERAAEKQGIELKPAHKYGAIARDGFPSTLERDTYGILEWRQKAGEIRGLKRYATVELAYGILWKIDFTFEITATGERCWAEAKGKWTADALLKLRMWKNGAGPGKLEIWNASRQGPQLTQVVIPRRGSE